MQLRETLLNLAITCILVLILVLVAVLLKESRPGPVATAVPVGAAGVADNFKPVSPTFIAFPEAEWIESGANEPDAFRLKIGAEEQVFVLYFVDALEATWTHPQRIAEQARWFGGTSNQAVVEGGQAALAYVRDLLKTKPFTVFTRWERVPNSSRCYAMLSVEYAPGKRAYLADLLLSRGFARVAGITTHLPENDQRGMEDYLVELNQLARQARSQKQGIWSGAPTK